ncbi:thioredoxin family protein [Eisenibacter elegans]|jgi:hypothetical protein|uniref:thioredoxin family protein n=1 Tax=Eisenibacter elegans TaxID=997 RepID=UPI000427A5B2|nr:thioredoxin family protein [Eisenibacter elegans]
MITPTHLNNAYTYETYTALIDQLLSEGKTTGTNQSEFLTEYTRMNQQRMKRWDKTYTPSAKVQAAAARIQSPQTWLILTEGWCGDAAQNIPLLVKIARSNPLITVKLLLRDEHLDVMDAFLTDGGRAIPKLIILNEALEVLADWGPRPNTAQMMAKEFKAQPDGDFKVFAAQLHKWYADNKGQELEQELEALLQKLV